MIFLFGLYFNFYFFLFLMSILLFWNSSKTKSNFVIQFIFSWLLFVILSFGNKKILPNERCWAVFFQFIFSII